MPSRLILNAFIAFILFFSWSSLAQDSESKPLDFGKVKALLEAGFDAGEVATLVKTKGYSDEMPDAKQMAALKAVGASAELVILLEATPPKMSPIKPESTQSGSFLDDAFPNIPVDELYQAKNQLGQTGLINRKGEWVVPPKWDHLYAFEHKGRTLVEVTKDEKVGVYTLGGKICLPCEYEIVWHNDGKFTVKMADKKWGLLDGNFQEILSCDFEDINLREGYLIVRKNGLASLFGPDGKMIFAPKWKDVEPIGSLPGKFWITATSGKMGIADETGKIVIEPLWDRLADFGNYLESRWIQATKDEKVGCINLEGEEIFRLEWEALWPLSDEQNLFGAKKNGKNGVIDEIGNTVIDFKWDDISWHPEVQRYIVEQGNGDAKRRGLLYKDGTSVFGVTLSHLFSPDEHGLFVAEKNGDLGWIDRDGNWKIKYGGEGDSFVNGVAAVSDTHGWFLINFRGERLTNEDTDYIDSVYMRNSDGRPQFYRAFRWLDSGPKKGTCEYGLMREDGRWVIPWQSKWEHFEIEDDAMIKVHPPKNRIPKNAEDLREYSEEFGYIDWQGKIVFYQGLAGRDVPTSLTSNWKEEIPVQSPPNTPKYEVGMEVGPNGMFYNWIGKIVGVGNDGTVRIRCTFSKRDAGFLSSDFEVGKEYTLTPGEFQPLRGRPAAANPIGRLFFGE